ncbi:hypothetical protein N2152v2_005546 [Parachlorella kessleri]
MLAAFSPLLPEAVRLGSQAAAGRLTLRTLQNRPLTELALLLFCFNPASVFFTAVYTESLYTAFSFLGLWLLPGNHWGAVLAFVAASATRSNGILNCWFLVHKLLMDSRQHGRLRVRASIETLLGCILVLAPYVSMQGYGYLTFCSSSAVEPPAWCTDRFPSLYGYVQRRYWGVGFLQFYKDPARLPMIVTALPVAYLSIRGCYRYFSSEPLRALSLGILSSDRPAPLHAIHSMPAFLRSPLAARLRKQGKARRQPLAGYLGLPVAPYVYHWALLTAVALLVMNVHVATRFLATCPALYWYLAHYINGSAPGSDDGARGKARGCWVWAWFGTYIVLGCLLFPNHYPWT